MEVFLLFNHMKGVRYEDAFFEKKVLYQLTNKDRLKSDEILVLMHSC